MATEDEQTLRKVRNEVTELRKLGEEWGMTSEEITSCINEAFSKKLKIEITDVIAKKMQTSKWSKIRFAFRLWLAFVILVSGFTVMVSHTDILSDVVNRVLQPYGYQLMRAVRLATVPLHRYNISSYHNAECFVTNPYFEEGEEDCYPCEGIKKVRLTKLSKEKELGSQFFSKPILFSGLQQTEVTLYDVMDLIEKEPEILSDPSLTVQSSVEWVKSVNDLNREDLLEEINLETDFHVEWLSRRISTSQLLRRLFPRPCVFPKKSEVVIDKTLFIAGPDSDVTPVNIGHQASNLFYIQGSGKRTLAFSPKIGCEEVCNSFEVNVVAGDVLSFPNAWSVELLPNYDEISISFLGGTTVN